MKRTVKKALLVLAASSTVLIAIWFIAFEAMVRHHVGKVDGSEQSLRELADLIDGYPAWFTKCVLNRGEVARHVAEFVLYTEYLTTLGDLPLSRIVVSFHTKGIRRPKDPHPMPSSRYFVYGYEEKTRVKHRERRQTNELLTDLHIRLLSGLALFEKPLSVEVNGVTYTFHPKPVDQHPRGKRAYAESMGEHVEKIPRVFLEHVPESLPDWVREG